MLADVRHFEHVPVQAGALDGAAEGGLVHARRAGRNDDAGEAVLVDGLLDGGLAGFGAGVHQVGGVDDFREVESIFGDLGTVDCACDVAAAVADENAYPHALPPWAVSWAAVLRAWILSVILSALTQSLFRPRLSASQPKAMPMSCVK